MKQKVSRGQLVKTENASAKKPSTAKGDVLCPKAFSDNASFRKDRKADSGSHLSCLNFQMGGTRLVGARELLWSPAAIHGEAWGSEVTNVLTVSFRNGGWWC